MRPFLSSIVLRAEYITFRLFSVRAVHELRTSIVGKHPSAVFDTVLGSLVGPSLVGPPVVGSFFPSTEFSPKRYPDEC